MKSCVIWGDMSSDSASENYPTVAVCDACATEYSKPDEDGESAILQVGSYDASDGDECYFCEISADDET